MSAHSPRTLFCVSLAITALAACSRSPEPPKVPLGQAQANAATPSARDQLPPAARGALDLGNLEYRAGRYDRALKAYRAAADAAPTDAAAYFGVYMVAQKIGNKALADTASRAIAARSGEEQMLTDSAMRTLHASGPGTK